jgi:hypothetical protein
MGHNDESLKKGAQTVSIEANQICWSVKGSMTFQYHGVQNRFNDQTFLFTSETFYVIGNREQVQSMLDKINITYIIGSGNLGFPDGSMVYWSVPCDDALPLFGFYFGSEDANSTGKLRNGFDSSAWTTGNGICYAPV